MASLTSAAGGRDWLVVLTGDIGSGASAVAIAGLLVLVFSVGEAIIDQPFPAEEASILLLGCSC